MPRDDNCPACGLPRFLNRKLVWTTDGGLYFQKRYSERLIFLEEGDIFTILEEAVRLGGEQLLDRLRECRRAFTRREVGSQLSGMRSVIFRHWPLAKRIVRAAFREAAFFGCGEITITSLVPGKKLIIKASHPYHPYLLAGDVWGFWEGLFGVEADLSFNASSDRECDITITTIRKSREKVRRRKRPRRPDRDYSLEVCEKCRLPLFPWELRWDTELGTIYQTGTHRHMTITYAEGWQLLLNEIRSSTGNDFSSSIGSALTGKEAAKYRLLRGENYKTAYRHFFLGLPFLGWGKPKSVSRKPFLIEAEMEGVPFPMLLGWKMAGVFEALEEEPADVQHIKEGDSDWRYLIGPRLDGSFLEIDRMYPEKGGYIYPRLTLPF